MSSALEHLRQVPWNRYLPEEIQANGENDGNRAQIKGEVGEPVQKTGSDGSGVPARICSRWGIRGRRRESRTGLFLFHGDVRWRCFRPEPQDGRGLAKPLD